MPTIEEFTPQIATILLDEEGALTTLFEQVLKTVYLTYASLSPITDGSEEAEQEEEEEEGKEDIFKNRKTLNRKDLNEFSLATNGEPMTEDTYSEIFQYLDLLDEDSETEGEERLTFKGFLQLYQLQTESDSEETWKDLLKWGYDRNLILSLESNSKSIEKVTEKDEKNKKKEEVEEEVKELEEGIKKL